MTKNLTVEEEEREIEREIERKRLEDQEQEQERERERLKAQKMMRIQANNEIYANMERIEEHKVFKKNAWHKEFINREHIIWENIDCEKFDTYFEGARKLILKLYKEEKEIEENYKNVKSYTGLKIGHKKPMVIPDDVKECLNSKLESTAGGGRNRKTKRNKNLCRGKSVKRPNKCKKVKGCKVAKGKKRTYCRKAHNKRRVTSKKR